MRTSVGRDPEVKYRQSGRTGGNVAETQLYIQNQLKVQQNDAKSRNRGT